MYNAYFNNPKTDIEIAFYIDMLFNTTMDNVIFIDGNIQNISNDNIHILDESIVNDIEANFEIESV